MSDLLRSSHVVRVFPELLAAKLVLGRMQKPPPLPVQVYKMSTLRLGSRLTGQNLLILHGCAVIHLRKQSPGGPKPRFTAKPWNVTKHALHRRKNGQL